MIPQTFPTETEQNLKRIPVQEQFSDTQTDSESLVVNGSRTRDAEMVRKFQKTMSIKIFNSCLSASVS